MSITVVWRVRGEGFNVDRFLAEHPELSPSLVWKKGERTGKKPSREEDSGANIPFCEHETLNEVMTVVRRWLKKWGDDLRVLQKCGGNSELDFALYVGSAKRFAAKIRFQPRDVLSLARAGVVISVSAYPTEG